MRAKVASLLKDPFLRNNAVFFFGSLFVSALNYLYHPALSRLLSIENFGDLEAILVVYGQIGIVLGVFGKIAINTVAHQSLAHDSTNEDHTKGAVMLRELYTLAVGVIGTLALLMIAFAFPIKEFFQFGSASSVVILAILVLCSIPYTFQSSILQGTHDFVATSISSAIQAGGRLIFAVLFILLGFGLQGAIVALAISQLVSLLYTYYKTRHSFTLRLTHLPHKELFRKEVPYAFLILITGAVITFLYTSDIIVVKYFFSPEIAGLYSGVSIIDNALFFITASIAGVLLPSIRQHLSFTENNRTFLKALALTSFIGGGVLVVFCLFPTIIVKLMIGAKYLPLSNYLPLLGLMIFMVSLSNLFISYFLALRRYALIPLTMIGMFVLVVALTFNHDSIQGIVGSYVFASATTLFLLMCFYAYYWVNESVQEKASN